MKKLIFTFLVLIPFCAISQDVFVKTNEVTKDYYKSIVFLSEGKTEWVKLTAEEYSGTSFRAVITRSGIYNNIYIEKVTYGMEGCCKKIVNTKEIPVNEIFNAFNIEGERSSVKFIKWISFNSFIVNIKGVSYKIEDINEENVKVTLQLN